MRRKRVRDAAGFGEVAAYSRAVRHGRHVAVSGTAALAGGRVLHPGDSLRQTRAAIRKALDAAAELGASHEDVVRTRLLLAPDCNWKEAARAHAEAFAGVDPANTTYYVGGLIPEGALVEVELDAIVEVVRVWVRVARFEGGTVEGLEAEMARSKQNLVEARTRGLPPGLEGVTRVVEGINREEGTGFALIFCETEEDLLKADQALNDMSPSEAAGRRVSAGMYEVMIDHDLS
jgi:enamine deaminase RidA (YjgF/YER057c/UK114 family)